MNTFARTLAVAALCFLAVPRPGPDREGLAALLPAGTRWRRRRALPGAPIALRAGAPCGRLQAQPSNCASRRNTASAVTSPPVRRMRNAGCGVAAKLSRST